jgi:multisubunit Na+/H+ antiporter MnhB subunit
MTVGGEERESRPFPDPERSLTPRKPRTVGGMVYLAVLAVTLSGLALVAFGHWRPGLILVGASLLAGAVGRLVIGNDDAGMLGMRPKPIDVVALTGLGSALVVLALLIPNRPLP